MMLKTDCLIMPNYCLYFLPRRPNCEQMLPCFVSSLSLADRKWQFDFQSAFIPINWRCQDALVSSEWRYKKASPSQNEIPRKNNAWMMPSFQFRCCRAKMLLIPNDDFLPNLMPNIVSFLTRRPNQKNDEIKHSWGVGVASRLQCRNGLLGDNRDSKSFDVLIAAVTECDGTISLVCRRLGQPIEMPRVRQ